MRQRKKFEGRCKELKGQIYDYSNSQQNAAFQYMKTTKALAIYAERTCQYGSDLRHAIENLELPVFPMPKPPGPRPPASATTEYEAWRQSIKDNCQIYYDRKSYIEEKMHGTLHNIALGQCTDSMKGRLLHCENDLSLNPNVIELLKEIRNVVYNISKNIYPFVAWHKADQNLYLTRQGPNESVQNYYERFVSCVDAMEHCRDAAIEYEIKRAGLSKDTASKVELDAVRASSQKRYYGCAFLLQADQDQYGELTRKLQNDFLFGRDWWPDTHTDAYNLLCRYKF